MSNYYYTIDYKGYPDPVIKASGSTYYIDYGAVDMDFQNGHFDVNPDCTELPCPAGTTNQGTYYNHTAASAGTSLGKISSDFPDQLTPDSICPKGWMLPTRLEDSNKSFANLIKVSYGEARTGTSVGNNMDVIALHSPLSFLRSGVYVYNTTVIGAPGIEGRYWGARVGSANNAHHFSAGSSELTTTATRTRGNGFSIRCVSRS